MLADQMTLNNFSWNHWISNRASTGSSIIPIDRFFFGFFSHTQSKTNALQATIDTLQGQLGAQEAKINDLNNELDTVQKHYDEQCQGNDDLKGQLADLQSQLKDTQRQKGNS